MIFNSLREDHALANLDRWFRTIHRVHRYYDKIIKDYKRNTQALAQSSGSAHEGRPRLHRQLSLREGGLGGGLEEFKLLEKTLQEFGVLEDEGSDIVDGEESVKGTGTSPDRTDSREAGIAVVKDERMEGTEGGTETVATRQDGWAAVNTVVNTRASSQTPDLVTMANQSSTQNPYAPSRPPGLGISQASGPHHQYGPSQPQHAQYQNASATPPNPPSLVSPGSRTVSTPSLASAYPGSEYFSQQPNQQQQQNIYQPAYPHQPSSNYALIQQPSQQASLHHHHAPLNSPLAVAGTIIHPEMCTSDQGGFWNTEAKEIWLNSLHTRLGGDDVAAFVDGSSWEDWVDMAGSNAGGVGGWLSTVWGAGARVVGS